MLFEEVLKSEINAPRKLSIKVPQFQIKADKALAKLIVFQI